MAVCRACHQLVEDDRVLCPYCYVPIGSTESLAHRPRAVAALVLVVMALAILVRLIVYRWF
jgi:hypothetical protein